MRCLTRIPLLSFAALCFFAFGFVALLSTENLHAEIRAGAAIVDITPTKFPVLVNGGFTPVKASEAFTPINARAIVLSDGTERIGIVVVDSCMLPRDLIDEAKLLASEMTELKPDRILISATHTHTAPSVMGALGTEAAGDYVPVLRAAIADALVQAERNLEPCRFGWGVGNAAEFTAVRRWIRRPDRIEEDPFGNMTVRANMHAGRNWDEVTGESGPEDPDLSMISFQATDGRPIAVLANFSMHYFSGQKPVAADYFGHFCNGLQRELGHDGKSHPPFVGIMSHGCSGDIWRRDYTLPEDQRDPFGTVTEYSDAIVKRALQIHKSIEYTTEGDLAMIESRRTLKYRVPDAQRLQWARKIIDDLGDKQPGTKTEVYALEQIILHERQSTEIVQQALRVGNIAIASTPNETYALTGMKIKLQSPLPNTMVIELANGGDGYIPPPEQHVLGGYNTWPARSAGLEVQAEPKIAERAIRLLEGVCRKPRRRFTQSRGPAAAAIRAANPVAWYRLDEFAGPVAADSSGNNRHATFEPAVAYFLEGPASKILCKEGEINRSVHFAGNRLLAGPIDIDDQYTISFWFWNGMPNDAREVTGWMYSRGENHRQNSYGEHLGIGGTDFTPGRLIYRFATGNAIPTTIGLTDIERWTWNHVAIVRKQNSIRIHLNGAEKPEIDTVVSDSLPTDLTWFFGGSCDNDSNWEGRMDEVAIFDRALSPAEVASIAKE